MNADTALKILANIAIEYVSTLKDRPASQEALLDRINLAHRTLRAMLPKPVEAQEQASDGHSD